jgi:hypothetical protein
LALADSASDEPTPGKIADTVTLPTGEQVRSTPDGGLALVDPSDEVFSTRLSNGDRVVIPVAKLPEVRSGRADARLYDVDALLRNGYSDARKVSEPSRLGERFMTGETRRADATTVTVNFTWLDGKQPPEAGGGWINLDTGESNFFQADKGTAAIDLKPGNYGILADMRAARGKEQDFASYVTDLKVTDKATTVAVDGTKAKKLAYQVDAKDAKPVSLDVNYFQKAGDSALVSGFTADAGSGAYAIPSDKPRGHEAGYLADAELSGPSDASKPYTYSLFDMRTNGNPADPTLRVHDDQLSRRTARYDGQGVKTTLDRQNLPDNPVITPPIYSPGVPVTVPSTRTEYYTASADVDWNLLADFQDDSRGDGAFRHLGALKPGGGKDTWLSAPVSVGLPDSRVPSWIGMERVPYDAASGKPELQILPAMFAGVADGEVDAAMGLTGTSKVSKDGKVLGSTKTGGAVSADLPKGDSGRYTVTFDGSRDATWTKLGTRSTATWTFDSAEVSKATPLDVSAVRFNASGVTDGYAKAGKTQDVSLDFVTQHGAADRTCASMAFQVSYDDGKTWKKVSIDRHGDHATAKLKHPSGTTFVSIKLSAKDDRGQTVETSTVRSYGLN